MKTATTSMILAAALASGCAIGISGALGGDKDAACAQTGLDKIARNL